MRGLDRRIDIERKSVSQDSYGGETESWTKIATRLAAWYGAVSGDERFVSDQFSATQQVEFRIRYREQFADLSPLDRIIYPASSSSPGEGAVYNILEVREMGRREALSIIAVRSTDVPAS